MIDQLFQYLNKPALYESSNHNFWDDIHISKEILKNHLAQNNDLATRNYKFVTDSVNWISNQFPSEQYNFLLDLGCGPGIYTELFSKENYNTTGIDFSKNSIKYAKSNALKHGLNINYYYKNYLEMNYNAIFDIITLIWCDYGALSYKNRILLLNKVYKALKPNGIFLFDIFTNNKFNMLTENKSFEYFPYGGFWDEKQHLCLNSSYLYYDDKTQLRQTIVITTEENKCYNVWEHYFTKEDIIKELETENFIVLDCFSSLTGEHYNKSSETISIVAKKI